MAALRRPILLGLAWVLALLPAVPVLSGPAAADEGPTRRNAFSPPAAPLEMAVLDAEEDPFDDPLAPVSRNGPAAQTGLKAPLRAPARTPRPAPDILLLTQRQNE